MTVGKERGRDGRLVSQHRYLRTWKGSGASAAGRRGGDTSLEGARRSSAECHKESRERWDVSEISYPTYIAVDIGIVDRELLMSVAEPVLRTRHMFKDRRKFFSKDEREEEAKRLRDEIWKGKPPGLFDRARSRLEFLLNNVPQIKDSTYTILLSAMSLTWTALECLIKVAWAFLYQCQAFAAGRLGADKAAK